MTASGLAALPLLELTVVLPLAGLLLALPLGHHGARATLALAPIILLVTALLCIEIMWSGAPIERVAGGWDVPLGIALRADGISGAFLLTTALVACAVAVFQAQGGQDGGATRRSTFWPLFLATWGALNAVFVSGDLFNLYVALELLTLAAVAMVAYGSTEAAMRYLLFALSGSLVFLLGVALIYAGSGTFDIGLLGSAGAGDTAMTVAAAFMTAGLLAKAALFPFHAWLPPAHGNAPTPASALLSALVVKAPFFILVRIWFDIGPETSGVLMQLLGYLGVAAILYGSLLAMRQERLKLVIAYSTVAQLGYLFLVFPLAGAAQDLPWTAGTWSGAIFHALSHALAKAALFLAAGIVIEAVGHDRLQGLAGLARDLPMTVFAFGIAAVSIMGLPPSGAFIGKYLMLTGALAGGHVFLAIVMIGGGLLAAAYLFRPLRLMLLAGETQPAKAIARRRQVVPLLLALAAVGLGIAASLPYALLQIGRSLTATEGIE
ncbi:complex I subunit 5 family protein [Lutibaculum baratangense]|uniref:NADH dehydrogenase (Quinone) n=1 Tax=Lutibaculum baratangense AMV1 TaxID=631454 RepID=V4QXQ6_9HYPH|nr:proton-conducting transporter membrane subunit [Lutibaculum baratangense]ESR24517.1 NADH dehydrogenase (quinone) [Lutibaculum baratangense AMV1]